MPVSLLLVHFKLKLSCSVNPVWISLFAWLFVVVFCLFCFLNRGCSDCMMLALSRYTYLCLHPLHFLPVLWLTADSGIKRDILGLKQKTRSTSLLEKDVPSRIRLEYFGQTQQTRGQLLTFCIDIWEISHSEELWLMEARHIPSMLKASFIRPGHIHVLHTMQQNSVPEQIRFPYLFYPVVMLHFLHLYHPI